MRGHSVQKSHTTLQISSMNNFHAILNLREFHEFIQFVLLIFVSDVDNDSGAEQNDQIDSTCTYK